MLLVTPAIVQAGVVAVCADGSIILAKKWSDVNCAGAVEVAPDDVPPIGSGIRPKPIAWANFLREQEAIRRASQQPVVGAGRVSNRPSVGSDVSTQPSRAEIPSLKLTSDEKRDLALLVDLSQRDTPAILEHTAAGARTAVLRIAHSRAFEAQLNARQRTARGPVLVFSLEPANAELSPTSLSFVQGGPGFHPRAGDPRELGWIDDGEAVIEPGNRRLGYIVLPDSFEVSRPLAVFWGDSVVATTLRR